MWEILEFLHTIVNVYTFYLTTTALLKETERTLLGLVAGLNEVLQCLLAALGGLAANDATMLVVLQVLASQTAGGAVSGTMHDFRTCANGLHLAPGLVCLGRTGCSHFTYADIGF
jgi:hypothetical protein